MTRLHAFTMPKWGIEMTEGVIAEWAIAEGEAFVKGQLLASVETEKIVNEIEAEFDAVCLRRIAREGDTLAVGELLAVFGPAPTSAADVDAFVAAFRPADVGLSGEDDAPAVAAAVDEPSPALPAGVAASPRSPRRPRRWTSPTSRVAVATGASSSRTCTSPAWRR